LLSFFYHFAEQAWKKLRNSLSRVAILVQSEDNKKQIKNWRLIKRMKKEIWASNMNDKKINWKA